VKDKAVSALIEQAGSHYQLTAKDYARFLRDGNTRVRVFAAAALRNLDGPDALPALQELIVALDDDDYLVRGYATDGLGNIGDKAAEAIPRIVGFLTRYEDAFPAVQALGNMGPAAYSALPALQGFLENVLGWDHEDDDVVELEEAIRQSILQILGKRP